MINNGFLEKVSDPADRRSVRVTLSSRDGERLVDACAPLIREANDLLFKDVRVRRWIRCADFLKKLVLNSELALASLRQREQARYSNVDRLLPPAVITVVDFRSITRTALAETA